MFPISHWLWGRFCYSLLKFNLIFFLRGITFIFQKSYHLKRYLTGFFSPSPPSSFALSLLLLHPSLTFFLSFIGIDSWRLTTKIANLKSGKYNLQSPVRAQNLDWDFKTPIFFLSKLSDNIHIKLNLYYSPEPQHHYPSLRLFIFRSKTIPGTCKWIISQWVCVYLDLIGTK